MLLSGKSTATALAVDLDTSSMHLHPHHSYKYRDDYPTNVTLRVGALLNPPYVMILEEEEDNDENDSSGSGSWHTNYSRAVASTTAQEELEYTGFSVDLLRRLQLVASRSLNITLTIQLEPLPTNWNYAVDLLANDCNTTVNPIDADLCQRYDFVIGGFINKPDRYDRVDFTPPFFFSYITAMKYVGDSTTGGTASSTTTTSIAQVLANNQTLCLPEGSANTETVINKFNLTTTKTTTSTTTNHSAEQQEQQYVICDKEMCFQWLKEGQCTLFVDDYMFLRSRAFVDPTLQITPEQFSGTFNGWIMSYSRMTPPVSHLIKYLMHSVVFAGVIDDLQTKYFSRELCPIGFAGHQCELPCHADFGIAAPSGTCECKSPKWSGEDCSVEVSEELHLIPQPLKVIAYTMVAINFAVVLICAIWLYQQRQTPQVKVSQPLFLGSVLFGCTISTSSIIAMAQEHNNGNSNGPVSAADVSCMAVPWLYSVGFSITFGTLFVKIYRIWIVFRNAAAFRRTVLTARKSFLVVATVLVVDVTILLVWTFVDPLHWTRTVLASDQFGNPLESAGYCTSEHWIIFATIIATLHLVVLAIASYLCYASRAIPTSFSEGKYVSIAMVSNLQMMVVGVPVLIIVGSDPDTSFFVRSAIIWMNDLVVVVLIFGNMIYSVICSKKATRTGGGTQQNSNSNINSNVQNMVRDAIKEYSSAAGVLGDSMAESSVVRQTRASNSQCISKSLPNYHDSDEMNNNSSNINQGSSCGAMETVIDYHDSQRLQLAKELSTPPPADDDDDDGSEEVTRIIWGRQKLWCGICQNFFGSPGLWTDHTTVDHEATLANKQFRCNNAATTTAETNNASSRTFSGSSNTELRTS